MSATDLKHIKYEIWIRRYTPATNKIQQLTNTSTNTYVQGVWDKYRQDRNESSSILHTIEFSMQAWERRIIRSMDIIKMTPEHKI